MATTTRPPIASWRTAAVYIDCPTPHCGGGVEGTDGSFLLDRDNCGNLANLRSYTCEECGQPFRIPADVLRVLGVSRDR